MNPKKHYRTWLEINTHKLRANVSEFLSFIPKRCAVMAVVKSNAYGHGIVGIASSLAAFRPFAARGWFAVDSITEALRLRREGIRLPILVLGYVLPERIGDAARERISITVSTFQTLRHAQSLKKPISIHLKYDTGMHRQGFFPEHTPALLDMLSRVPNVRLEGIYTHFASAKDGSDSLFTDMQCGSFDRVLDVARKAYPAVVAHASASGGTLLFPQTWYDAVRIGIGCYGYFPSPESKQQLQKKIALRPIMEWKSVISEIKIVPKGAYVGYDLSEKLTRRTRLAVIPIGYWHGFDRRLSSTGVVLIGGKRARVIGRVSMDMITVDITAAAHAAVGDTVTLIGRNGRSAYSAEDMAHDVGTSAYEIMTRINPLIYKQYL